MRSIGLLIAIIALTTQGCATTLGSHFGETRGDRPGLIGGFRSDQANAGGFGGNRVPASVPTDLPLPLEANPRNLFTLPNVGTATSGALYSVANGISVLLNCIPDLSGKAPRECAAKADRNFRDAIPQPREKTTGPVILK